MTSAPLGDPPDIDTCPDLCRSRFNRGTLVRLFPSAESSFGFDVRDGWSGWTVLSATPITAGATQIRLSGNPLSPDRLTGRPIGVTGGILAVQRGFIASAIIDSGTTVITVTGLLSQPGVGNEVALGCQPSDEFVDCTIELTINTSQTLIATFDLFLTVGAVSANGGSGLVTVPDSAIACATGGVLCGDEFAIGSTVTLKSATGDGFAVRRLDWLHSGSSESIAVLGRN